MGVVGLLWIVGVVSASSEDLVPHQTLLQRSLSARAVPEMPACATKCVAAALAEKLCAPTDKLCICTNAAFQGKVSACVTVSCKIPDQLATRNASLTNCGAPVRDKSQRYATLSNVLVSITGVFVALRFGFKIFITEAEFGLDDYAVIATFFTTIPSAILTVYGTTANGLGKDIWTLSAKQITNAIYYFYMMAWLYFLQVALLKLCLICFYMRVFPSREVQRVLWGSLIFCSLWGFAFVLTTLFQCQPIHYFWTKWDGMHAGKCANANAITWSNAIISIALDLWILAIPLWLLRDLKLHWKKKIGVAMMFCVGTFVTVVSILRLQSLVNFAKGHNATWDFYDVSLWSTVEICVGIMCACLPNIRLLLVRLFPVLSSSSYARSNNRRTGYYENQYGKTGSKLGSKFENITTKSRIEHDLTSGKSSEEDLRASGMGTSGHAGIQLQPLGPPPASGIMVKTSYAVQHTDTDEASLISKKSTQ